MPQSGQSSLKQAVPEGVSLREVRLRCIEVVGSFNVSTASATWIIGEARELEEYVLGGGQESNSRGS